MKESVPRMFLRRRNWIILGSNSTESSASRSNFCTDFSCALSKTLSLSSQYISHAASSSPSIRNSNSHVQSSLSRSGHVPRSSTHSAADLKPAFMTISSPFLKLSPRAMTLTTFPPHIPALSNMASDSA